MSAFGGKADLRGTAPKSPLIAISGHWWANENGGSGEPDRTPHLHDQERPRERDWYSIRLAVHSGPTSTGGKPCGNYRCAQHWSVRPSIGVVVLVVVGVIPHLPSRSISPPVACPVLRLGTHVPAAPLHGSSRYLWNENTSPTPSSQAGDD